MGREASRRGSRVGAAILWYDGIPRLAAVSPGKTARRRRLSKAMKPTFNWQLSSKRWTLCDGTRNCPGATTSAELPTLTRLRQRLARSAAAVQFSKRAQPHRDPLSSTRTLRKFSVLARLGATSPRPRQSSGSCGTQPVRHRMAGCIRRLARYRDADPPEKAGAQLLRSRIPPTRDGDPPEPGRARGARSFRPISRARTGRFRVDRAGRPAFARPRCFGARPAGVTRRLGARTSVCLR